MPRSSRHKSSKHSSRDGREYSDSEKDLSLKERKGKDDSASKVSKGLVSAEKRKFELKDDKDVLASANGGYSEEYSGSSKRRKERVANDVGNDRWNGGGEDGRGEGSKKSKALNDSNSKRKEENDVKHRDLSRKEGREGGGERERERKGKESVRVTDNDKEGVAPKVKEFTESSLSVELRKHEPADNQLDKRSRRRDGSGDGDKHQDHIGAVNVKRLSSRDDIGKDKREKDEKPRNQRSREKHREDVDWDDKQKDDKQTDERPAKDHNSRSDDENLRDEKDTTEVRQKKSKPQYHDHDYDVGRDRDSGRYQDRDKDRDRGRERKHDRDLDRGRNRTQDKEWDRESGRDLNHEHSREHDRERDRDRHRGRDRDRESDRDRDRDLDHDGSHVDERNARYKDSRGKKRSADDLDDSNNDFKSRGIKAHYSEMEKKSLGRGESDVDRGRSQSGQVHLESANNRRASPNSNSYVHIDDYRHLKSEDLKYRDSVTEQRSKSFSSREVVGFSGVSERASKKRSLEKSIKMDDGNMGELAAERSSNSKASPKGLVERSPSSTGIERRYMNRAGVRRSLDVEETGRRGSASIDAREFGVFEDRGRAEKPLVDDFSQADSSFHHRTSRSNSSSLIHPPPTFRPGLDSPSFMGSLEEESRGNSVARHKWSGDRTVGRGHGNAWRGVPNWSSPAPNGLIPFQHGPRHGGYQAMMPQFPSVPLLGVRPPMEINHSGFPYHIPDTEMFAGHLRPPGWQNVMGGSGTSHLHGWDGNNGVFRDEAHMYGVPDWDQNRHMMNGQGWETRAEMWKGSNGDANKDLSSTPHRETYPVQALLDNDLAGQTGQKSQYENNHPTIQAKVATMHSDSSPAKEISKAPPKTTNEKTLDLSKKSTDEDPARLSYYYLSKLDISEELTHSELYNQCMSLLDLEKRATVERETTHLHLKDAARSRQKTFYAKLSSRPANQDSVLKIAMELYTKQCTKMRGMAKDCHETVPLSIADAEMTDVPIPIPDQTGEDDSTVPAQELPVKMEVQAQSFTEEREEPSTIISEEIVDSVTSEQANLEAEEEPFSNLDNASDTCKTNNVHSAYSAERQTSGDVVSDPLFESDGSFKACEALTRESNESESVILSRIHHSTESTH